MAGNKEVAVEIVEKTLDAADAVAEEVIEVVETVERIPRLRLNGTTRGQQMLILGVTFAAGVAVGGTVTYFVVHKKLRDRYEALIETEVQQTREHYDRIHKTGDYADPEALLARLHGEEGLTKDAVVLETEAKDAFESYGGEVAPPVSEEILVSEDRAGREMKVGEKKNIFDRAEVPTAYVAEFDYDKEVLARTDEAPYVITRDEFYEGEKDYEQANLTYYEGDETLVDSRGDVIPDESIVGEDHLVKFGYGSGDKNVIFVRNDELTIDFEITRSQGKYTKEVLGFEDEDESPSIRHSGRGVRRFRDRDE